MATPRRRHCGQHGDRSHLASARVEQRAHSGESDHRAVRHREWRQRGVATALLGTQISGARQAEIEDLRAWVTGSAGAQFLRTIGFEEATSFIELQGPLF